MRLRARLARLEAGHHDADEWIEAPLDPEAKLASMELHLVRFGTAGAPAYARELHQRRERRRRVEAPLPPEVEERFQRFRRARAAEEAAMDPTERAALARERVERTALARQILEEAERGLALEPSP